MPNALTHIAALVAVGAVGVTALEVTAGDGPRGVRPTSVQQPAPPVDRVAVARPMPDLKPPARAAAPAPKPVAKAAPKHPKPAKPSGPWLPTGTGMWIYQWGKSSHGHAHSVVAKARSVGLTTLYVRTGSSHDGFTGTGVLHALLPATRNTPLHVVAWDFPELDNPAADARRLARAARVTAHGARVAAVAPDIETRSEGTHLTASRVRTYLKTLRRLLPTNVAILTTVPWPSKERRRYPYATVAHYSNALLPMAYWYDNSPRMVTSRSVAFLRRFGKPVQPVGQGYDGKLDVPSLPHNNLRKQVPAFLSTARSMHVTAVSLWSWQSAPPVTWSALARAQRWFPVSH